MKRHRAKSHRPEPDGLGVIVKGALIIALIVLGLLGLSLGLGAALRML